MPLLQQVLERNPKDVKLVFKNYPLTMHRFARSAATAALAAGDQGKYWEFHDQLLEQFASIDENKILEIARGLNLDLKRFNRKRADPAIQELIGRDLAEAQENGVNSTPSVFINGKPLRERSVEGIQEMIRAELQGR